MKRVSRIWAVMICGALWLQGCSTNPVTGRQDLVLMSEQQEIAMGRQYHAEILKGSPPYNDPTLQAYVNKLGQELARASHRSDLEFHFTVVDSPDINAFALPGGYIYITRGIMAYLNSEAELAGVIGHEIGHVTARHGVRQQTAQTIVGLGAAVLAATTGVDGRATNTLGTALVRGYGRGHELEADRLGAEYLAKVGYQPEHMIDVVRVLKNQELFSQQVAREAGKEPGSYHGLFSTHPDNDTRLKEVISAARRYASTQPRQEGRDRYLQQLNGVIFGDNAAEGVVRGNRFYHQDLNVKMEAPKGWRIDNQPKQLVFIAPQDKLITVARLNGRKQSKSPIDFAKNVLGIKDLRDPRPYQSKGREGLIARTLIEKTPYDGARIAEVNIVFDGDKAWSFFTFAKERGGLDLYEREIRRLPDSLAPLTAQDRALAQARKIRLHRVRSGDTFTSLARNSKLGEHAVDKLKLINGLYPDGVLPVGQLIKVVD